jgi:hypothetical protein
MGAALRHSSGGLAAAEMTVVRAIADALSVEATGIATDSPVGIDSESAYKAFLDANALRNQRTEASLRWAIERYSEALRIDGDFAAAHAGLASAWLLLYEYSNLSLSEAQRAAQAHIDHALRLSIRRSACRGGPAKLNQRWARAGERLRRAALERGNATTMMWLGTAPPTGRLGDNAVARTGACARPSQRRTYVIDLHSAPTRAPRLI